MTKSLFTHTLFYFDLKTIFILFSFLMITPSTVAQFYRVTEVKKSFYASKKKIKKGDTLNLKSNFFIEKKGKLTFQHINEWYSIYTQPRKYRMDSLIGEVMASREYKLHDSVYTILKKNNILHCKFPYKIECRMTPGGAFATYYADDIRLKNDHSIETSEPKVRIEWSCSVPYDGVYYILIKNMFEDYVDIKVTSEKHIELDLRPYKHLYGILYKVISEECRESFQEVIVIK